MSSITVDVVIHRSRHEVWAEIRHIDRHVLWMSDARRIDFHTNQREGVGTSFDCLTAIGPLRTRDVMTITRWEDEQAIGVTHNGIFTGHGEFRLRSVGDATRMTWHEELRFPWWLFGPVGARVARPLLRGVWRRNLRNLARLLAS